MADAPQKLSPQKLSPQKLSLADHALIHITGYLAIELPHETWEAFRRELAPVLPRANRDIAIIAEFAVAADQLIRAATPAEVTGARGRAERVLTKFHQSRAASALDALRAAEPEEVAPK